ncbi:uncharacterized protein LOC135694642 [Rhopilema esculentum]|uniref:uncharacterized protein LOC135694642 n=1 Tax=Rhopilema esculentum TaxID=499914 RepID=UPI0031DDEACA
MDASKYLVLLVLLSLHVLGNGHEIEPERPTKLTSRNFHTILSLDDPWIVVFLEDYAKKEPELIALATSVVGVVQVGFVDMDDPECDELIEAKHVSRPHIRVYEFGEENKERPLHVSTYEEAVEAALESYPDTFERITAENIPLFYSKAMREQKPRKLPVIYFSDTDRVKPVLRYFSITLKSIFSFGMLVNPTRDLMGNLSIENLPQLIVLTHLNLKSGAFEIIKYDKKAYGPYNVPGVLRFLLGVQNESGDKKHRKTLEKLLNVEMNDKPSRKQQPGVEELTYSSIDRICGSKSTAVCVIAFLGNSNKEYIKEKEAILDRVRKSETVRDHHVRYSWLNATCHENIAEAFAVDMTQLPFVIAVKRLNKEFAHHIGSFSFGDLREFLLAVLSRRKRMTNYKKFPLWLTKDCRLTKTSCLDGICRDAKKRNKKRGPKLSGAGGDRTEL